MKKIVLSFSLLLALCFGIVFNSCEKEKNKGSGENTNPTENPFVGIWRWTSSDAERTLVVTFKADKTCKYVFSDLGYPDESYDCTYDYSESTKILIVQFSPDDTWVTTYNFTSLTKLVLTEKDVEDETVVTILIKQ